MSGCHEEATHASRNLSLQSFSDLKVDEYALNAQLFKESLGRICRSDTTALFATVHTKQYYESGRPLLWVSYDGVDSRADSLLAVLRRQLPAMGFSLKAFGVERIADDMERLRHLRFDRNNPVSTVAARIEYNLTKAYMRYVVGQRFGFVNPGYVLNHYDASAIDSTGKTIAYRRLFDIKIERPGQAFFDQALHQMATADGLCRYMESLLPTDSLYLRLLQLLPSSSGVRRKKLLVNMERCRWHDLQTVTSDDKYVVVNIPAFHLWAVSPDTVVDMRVACGAVKTKTPLLSSKITHMEVNPEWVIPMSIVSSDVARHAGDTSYFARHRYYIVERKSGSRISPRHVTTNRLLSGNYRVAQQGGAGNSLGRIIFRFPNNFSVFLHDTSSPGAFGRDNRGVSHGCVRVQRPFDLAVFLMEKDPDEWLLDKLRISMGMKPETEEGQSFLDGLDPAAPAPRLVKSLQLSTRVPLFIKYNTIYPTPDGQLQYYPDVYGYDVALGEALKPLIDQ